MFPDLVSETEILQGDMTGQNLSAAIPKEHEIGSLRTDFNHSVLIEVD